MKIRIIYIDKLLEEKSEKIFLELDWFGLWIANNYEDIEIIEIIQEEQ